MYIYIYINKLTYLILVVDKKYNHVKFDYDKDSIKT